MARPLALAPFFCLLLVACAASEKRPTESVPARQSYPDQPSTPPSGGAAAPQTAPGAYGQPAYAPTPHQREIGRAHEDVEAAQRELDVAAGDCKNACRALGSMDRAAGRLCGIAQGPDEAGRCDDAKRRLYSARDRVKSTCGSCPDGTSVERSAPVPSR